MPLEVFKGNLRSIVNHRSVTTQKPQLILITPPPVNEYRLEESNLVKGLTDPQRTAEHTRKYADATREVAAELGVVILDLWSVLMAMTGWKEGEPLIGSKKVARSEVLDQLLVDGPSISSYFNSETDI